MPSITESNQPKFGRDCACHWLHLAFCDAGHHVVRCRTYVQKYHWHNGLLCQHTAAGIWCDLSSGRELRRPSSILGGATLDLHYSHTAAWDRNDSGRLLGQLALI